MSVDEVLTMSRVGADVPEQEQALYPDAPDVPRPVAVRTREHLAGRGPAGARRPHLDQ